MPAPQEIVELVARFERHHEAYKAGSYNETQLRRDYLDPFFKALGWDMDNTAGYDEAYRDVVHEDAVKIGGATKAPDYGFRIGSMRKFFLEAKKPSVVIRDEIPPAYQLRRYAWNAKLPLSILSDFEEFAVYDGRFKPGRSDPAATARVFYCTFRDYAEKWDWIASVFSREAVLKGSFDRYAESNKAKRGTAEVDVDFLAAIEGWREDLAENLALRNPGLTQRELNFSVQRILDRIIFLRICEDRGIEDYGRLLALTNGPRIYPRLGELFHHADTRYNSGLFHFKAETGRDEPPDGLTLGVEIDDKLLRDLLKGLYFPDSPYEFRILSADILGQVYEQFLGKVIRLTAGHRAKVEHKPDVKRAGGVYYTPTYIVEYIIRQTVGRLVEGKTPAEVENIKVLDPACGSGSFLLVAFQHLLDWHLRYYLAHDVERWARRKRPAVVRAGGGWRLTVDERKRILLANIHGVDIDAQAVEVTKLSLLLKVLEGETVQSLQPTFDIFHERALPDLGDNIKCGNSLIGPDLYQGTGLPSLTDEDRYHINTFDWQAEFAEIHEAGGFDAVVGNPPYVRSRHIGAVEKSYHASAYETGRYQPDLSAFFIERGARLMSPTGRLSFIVPNGVLTNTQYEPLRRLLLTRTRPEVIVDLKSGVFANAAVDTSILVVAGRGAGSDDRKDVVLVGECEAAKSRCVRTPVNEVLLAALLERPGCVFNSGTTEVSVALCDKILAATFPLGRSVDVKAGMKVRKQLVATSRLDPRHERFLGGKDVKPYAAGWRGMWVCYDKSLEARFSNQAFRDRGNFEVPVKLLVRQVMGPGRIFASADTGQFFCDQSVYILVPRPDPDHHVHYLLALLSSRLMAYYFNTTNGDRKATFPKIKGDQIKQLPIHVINRSEKSLHDQIVALVETMLDLGRRSAVTRTPQEQTALKRQMAATDSRIDSLVYGLYGLSEAEIAVVEGRPVAPEENAGLLGAPALVDRYAEAPSPPRSGITPEQAFGDSAHYFSAKEAPGPYRTR